MEKANGRKYPAVFDKREFMLTSDIEINYLIEAVPLLDQYLNSKEFIWQLPGIARIPGLTFGSLTIGVVLFMLKRLKARSLSDKLETRSGDLEDRTFQAKIHNKISWMKKSGQDLNSRSRYWESFLNEYRDDPIAAVNRYPSQVSQRVIMQLLWEEQDPGSLYHSPLEFEIHHMDAILQADFLPGGFIWEDELQNAFPEDEFWYLYGRLDSKEGTYETRDG
ncbi:MAG: hypothetical protein JW704_01850 [Anaerolineaceae bacterium]|nr:hypothetical protein [Anaerolineaceae bacterium]